MEEPSVDTAAGGGLHTALAERLAQLLLGEPRRTTPPLETKAPQYATGRTPPLRQARRPLRYSGETGPPRRPETSPTSVDYFKRTFQLRAAERALASKSLTSFYIAERFVAPPELLPVEIHNHILSIWQTEEIDIMYIHQAVSSLPEKHDGAPWRHRLPGRLVGQ